MVPGRERKLRSGDGSGRIFHWWITRGARFFAFADRVAFATNLLASGRDVSSGATKCQRRVGDRGSSFSYRYFAVGSSEAFPVS